MNEQDWQNAWDIYDDCVASGGDPVHCEGAARASYPGFTTSGAGADGGGGGRAL